MSFSAPTVANATVSNLPGPQADLLCGRTPCSSHRPRSIDRRDEPLPRHRELRRNRVDGVTADRNALPDPANYADCMQAAFDELLAAAD